MLWENNSDIINSETFDFIWDENVGKKSEGLPEIFKIADNTEKEPLLTKSIFVNAHVKAPYCW